MKKCSIFLSLVLFLVQFSFFSPAMAASSGDVVINEIAWMGSIDNTNDEYIELHNTTNAVIDLSGWYITDDGTTDYLIESGSIAANGFFLIEDAEEAVNTITADAVISMSLANTGDTLVLYDNNDVLIDTVNSADTMWAAGDNDTKATMERIDASADGDDAGNWATNQLSSGDEGREGSAIEGSPRTVNSVSTYSGTTVSLAGGTPQPGQNWIVSINVNNSDDVFSYGLEMDYDQSQLSLIGVDPGNFLSENQTVSTSFHYGMDSVNNTLIIGEARTQNSKTTVSGSGTLVTLTFQVMGGDGAKGTLDFLGSAFLGGLEGDIPAVFEDRAYTIGGSSGGNDVIQNLQVAEGTERYSLALSWDAPVNGAESYNIYRTNPHGAYELIGTTAELTFVDDDSTTYGGNIIPTYEYEYSVTAMNGGVESDAVFANGQDPRGIKGDTNRSDRVDGRDLESLALHFAEDDSEIGFNPLIDTSYDGFIDGDDLIDIGTNWAEHYVQ